MSAFALALVALICSLVGVCGVWFVEDAYNGSDFTTLDATFTWSLFKICADLPLGPGFGDGCSAGCTMIIDMCAVGCFGGGFFCQQAMQRVQAAGVSTSPQEEIRY